MHVTFDNLKLIKNTSTYLKIFKNFILLEIIFAI